MSRDPGEVALLWSAGAAAFFEGKDDPNIAVLHVTANDGQYWDGEEKVTNIALALAYWNPWRAYNEFLAAYHSVQGLLE